MEPLKQRLIELTLVAIIKGVAITGLVADVAIFYATKHADRIKTSIRKKFSSARMHPSQN